MQRSAVVLVVDGLSANFLGPYGNTWTETPALNHLASQSLLWEFAHADSARLDDAYSAYWHNRHAAATTPPATTALPNAAAEQGGHTMLVTDDPGLSRWHSAMQQVIQVADAGPDGMFAGVCVAALAALDSIPRGTPFLLWIHARGFTGPWDAPAEYRERFADEEDPEAPDIEEPPRGYVNAEPDPDQLWGWARAYAGQLKLLDECLGGFLDALESRRLRDTAFVLTSPRGYPMGDHGALGPDDSGLYADLVHVPLLLRLPNGEDQGLRSRRLVQPADLCATLTDWLQFEATAGWGRNVLDTPDAWPILPWDQSLSIGHDGEAALRTNDWWYRRDGEDRELFVKPDDRWEVNQIADRCRDLLPYFDESLDALLEAAAHNDRDRMVEVADQLHV